MSFAFYRHIAPSSGINKGRLANPRHGFFLILRQTPRVFSRVNRTGVFDRIKSEEGFANLAGVELTLLDCARYFHKAGGINAVAQVAKDVGDKADSAKLAKIAAAYENSSVRRLGFLLDWAGHERQARAGAVRKESENGYAAESGGKAAHCIAG